MERTQAHEELAWIRSLMSESQSFLSGTWKHQLVWGLIATVGLVATWFAIQTGSYGSIPWGWAVLIAVGWAYSLLSERSGSRHEVRNVAGRAFGGLWMGLGGTLTLLGGLSLTTGVIEGALLTGLVPIVFGAGYFASGYLAGLRWLSGVGVAWWAGGVALLFWDSPDAILALAAMTATLEMGPALVLQQIERTRREAM